MRFTRKNWNKFFDGSDKSTTIRVKMSKLGHHKAYAGPYMKPEILGEFDIVSITSKLYKELTDEDAINDGFNSLYDLKLELLNLNGGSMLSDQLLHIHHVQNVRKRE